MENNKKSLLKTYILLLLCLIVSIFIIVSEANSSDLDDKVASLPGVEDFNEDMYSGYVDLEGTEKSIHYVLVKSRGDATTEPLLVWFNGGPGCSSMYGLFLEVGPYLVRDSGEVEWNEYAWNREASVLYVDQPAGVGYSYCGSTDDCSFNDDSSADDNLQFLLQWFDLKHPEFKTNDLYLAGESYAGIYVPYLLTRIHDHNTEAADDDSVFKPVLKGIIVLNGVTDWKYDTYEAMFKTACSHFIIDPAECQELAAHGCSYPGNSAGPRSSDPACA